MSILTIKETRDDVDIYYLFIQIIILFVCLPFYIEVEEILMKTKRLSNK